MRNGPPSCVYTDKSKPLPPAMPYASSSSDRRSDPAPGPDADEREFDAFTRTQDPLDVVAATWVVRRRNGLGARGEAELRAWLAADPRHRQAFEDMDATFGNVRQLPDDDVARLKAGLPDGQRTAEPRPTTPAGRPSRPWSSLFPRPAGLLAGLINGLRPLVPRAAAATAALSILGAGWMGWEHWRQQPVFEQGYATGRGQRLTANLPDAADPADPKGSTLQFDTATRAQVRLYRDHREVRLEDGQAVFAVRSDARRPFHVYAGALRITVTGTRFSVRHTDTGLDAGRTVVSVEEGRVRVARAEPGERADTARPAGVALELTAGQKVAADAQGQLGAVGSLPPGAIAPWRDGRLNFDHTPLAQAIAEFERYGDTGLVVRDPAVAALPVGGSYSPSQHQQFARALPQLLPVRLVRRGGVTEVVALPR